MEPNLHFARLYNCEVIERLVRDLCFAMYEESLSCRLERIHEIIVDVIIFFVQVAEGVVHNHKMDCRQKDINPQTVMFDSKGSAVIIDIDSGRLLGETLGAMAAPKGIFKNKKHSIGVIRCVPHGETTGILG